MRGLLVLYFALVYPLLAAAATKWYFLRWTLPAGGQGFTRMSGRMRVPSRPSRTGKYYLWPGLQTQDSSFVLQTVVDGEYPDWFAGTMWCCGNGEKWVPGHDVYEGQWIDFSFTKNGNNWNTELRIPGKSTVSGTFNIGQRLNQALLAIELVDVNWDFGQLEFADITMEAEAANSLWCLLGPDNYENNANVDVPITGIAARSTGNGMVTCTVSKAILRSPRR